MTRFATIKNQARSLMIDLYHVYCINDKDLQEITKTEVVG